MTVITVGDQLSTLVKTGSYKQAVWWMNQVDSKLVFDACFALAVSQPQLFQALWEFVPWLPGQDVSDFALDLVHDGTMPQKPYANMDWSDYDNAREVYLRAWETKRPPGWPSDRVGSAKNICLYPEYLEGRTRRDAIVQLALSHVGCGPSDRFQANLFCLGGKYTFSIGKLGAHPLGKGTTCMLFARSVLHAAGVNVIGPFTPTSCSCDSGLSKEISHLKCFVDTKKAEAPPQPKPGDVFLIQGPNFGMNDDGSGGYGSGHVGVITSIAGNQWTVVQGGAPNHINAIGTRTLTPMSGSKEWGTWYFPEDSGVNVKGVKRFRGLQGYWSIDNIGAKDLMHGGAKYMGW